MFDAKQFSSPVYKQPNSRGSQNSPSRKKSKKKTFLIILAVVVVLGGIGFWKAGGLLSKITTKGGLLTSLVKSLPGNKEELQGEKEGRINIALLGMRGENVPGGGTLADTIMILSLHPGGEAKEGESNDPARASLVSIPRDLYVTRPGQQEQRKINAVYSLGRERGEASGLEDMQTVLTSVTGQPIHYVLVINFKGFIELVDAVGGITLSLTEPFNESKQFHEPQVCDPYVYTLPTKPPEFQHKYHTRQDGSKYITKSYPLCYNHTEECGGNFGLPAGDNQLNGPQALCYARSRYTTSDFDRARRQQAVLQALKTKALSVGTLADFGKLNGVFDSLGNNVLTNLEGWELKRLFDLSQSPFKDVQADQKVLEDSEEGLLYNPPPTPDSGYILLPRGDNYDRIHALFQQLP